MVYFNHRKLIDSLAIKDRTMTMIKAVYFYRITKENEIITYCKLCAKHINGLEEIDRAGDWDICSNCEAQNVPSWYDNTGKNFKAGTLN